jgi:hypothetical protein
MSGAWAAVLIGFAGLSKDLLSIFLRWITSPDMNLKPDENAAFIISNLALTQDYINHGYRIDIVPSRTNEFAVRSPTIDAFLRTNDFTLVEDCQVSKSLNKSLQESAKILEDALRCKYRKSWRADPPLRFINEEKTCLASDLFHKRNISIYRGTYFHSFLTNELTTSLLESRGHHPQITYRGSVHFPAFHENNGQWHLKRICESHMSNHIGVSTIVITNDGYLVLWRQSGGSQQSSDLLAPTGSGSCDWSDWSTLSNRSSLKALLSRAMEREFREESNPLESVLHNVAIRTEIIGYFRWARRAGKPEFVGISKIDAPLSALKPNTLEVDAPKHFSLYFPASNEEQLQTTIHALFDKKQLSVPLWVNLTCLQDVLQNEPEVLRNLIWT